MRKGENRQGGRAKAPGAAPRPQAAGPDRRQRERTEDAKSPMRAQRSAAMRLVAEVERLENELAAARVEMAELAARADIDPLTDLLNRRGFERELRRSLAYVKRHRVSAAFLYIDLDRFKSINDRHGHAVGDALLRAIAMVLTRHVRSSDVVTRLGGDEFAMLLWNISETDAQTKAHIVEEVIGRTTAAHAGTTVTIGASVGVTPLLPLDRAADVIDRADRAMYARKAARNALSN
jgi:diguanylate cyclase (GGDEF)-like protein